MIDISEQLTELMKHNQTPLNAFLLLKGDTNATVSKPDVSKSVYDKNKPILSTDK